MFGKRKEDRKHRFAEEGLDDVPEGEERPDAEEDPELMAALMQLGLNRHAPLVDPPAGGGSIEFGGPSELDVPSGLDEAGESEDLPDDVDASNEPAYSAVPTAAMLAEPETVESAATAVSEDATYTALRRERARAAEQEAALRTAQDEAQALRAELRQLQAAAKATSTDSADAQAATSRADELEDSLRASQGRVDELTSELEALRAASGDVDIEELRSAAEHAAAERADAAEKAVHDLEAKVSALTAELEQSRSDAAAAGVALERFEREAKDQDGKVVAAEERAERLAAEIEQLRAESAKGPVQVERLQREVEREKALRSAMEQAQAAHAQAEAVLADNRQLAADLASNLQSQEGLIFALAGIQTEVTEQRAWFEAQIATAGESETQHAGVIEALQSAIQERDAELEVLRQQLLEAETKRAEEAAAFVAALERP